MNKRLLRNVRAPLEEGVAKRHYFKYATRQDVIIPLLGSSLPILNPQNDPRKVEEDQLLQGFGHGSIVYAKIDEQIKKTEEFIKE